MSIKQMLQERNLPPLKSREEMKEILLEKLYGKMPDNIATYQEGGVAYHRRHGKHVLSRYDWNKYMDYILRHLDD